MFNYSLREFKSLICSGNQARSKVKDSRSRFGLKIGPVMGYPFPQGFAGSNPARCTKHLWTIHALCRGRGGAHETSRKISRFKQAVVPFVYQAASAVLGFAAVTHFRWFALRES